MDRRIEAAIRIMELHASRQLPVGELARRVRLSPWHFIRLFKAETSITPKQYQRFFRMKQAQELLGSSFLSVKEVAANVGFEDRSHFSRDFKKISGHAPTAFRVRSKPEAS
jgi:transcriptional regulator GlxA family with amidase domain